MEKKNVGIKVDQKIFPPSSEIDESVDKNVVHDADVETSVTFQNERPIPKARTYQSDTSDSAEYYRMKLGSNVRPPNKIEFQMVNKSMKKNIRRQSKCNSDHCQCNSLPPQRYPSAPYMAQNNASYIDMMHNNFERSRNESGKMPGIFSCFMSNDAQKHANDKDLEKNEENDEKTEYYHFDHGDYNYFNTTDRAPQLLTDNAARKVHSKATKFWAEFFGTINIAVTFILVFFMQFYRFILYSIFRSVFVDFLQTTSDYFIKPLLATVFNGIIQPVLLFLRNIFQSVWNTLEPVAQMLLGFFIPFIECLRAVRIVDVKFNSGIPRSSFIHGSHKDESIA